MFAPFLSVRDQEYSLNVVASDFKMCNGGGHVTCGLCRIRQERINECSLCKRQRTNVSTVRLPTYVPHLVLVEDPNPLVKQLMEAINFPCPLFCGKLLPVSQRLVHNVNCSAVKLTCPLCFTYESYSAPVRLNSLPSQSNTWYVYVCIYSYRRSWWNTF